MASRETSMVKKEKGKGSMFFMNMIQKVKMTTWRMKNAKLPAVLLISSANLSVNLRFFWSLASREWGIKEIVADVRAWL